MWTDGPGWVAGPGARAQHRGAQGPTQAAASGSSAAAQATCDGASATTSNSCRPRSPTTTRLPGAANGSTTRTCGGARKRRPYRTERRHGRGLPSGLLGPPFVNHEREQQSSSGCSNARWTPAATGRRRRGRFKPARQDRDHANQPRPEHSRTTADHCARYKRRVRAWFTAERCGKTPINASRSERTLRDGF